MYLLGVILKTARLAILNMTKTLALARNAMDAMLPLGQRSTLAPGVRALWPSILIGHRRIGIKLVYLHFSFIEHVVLPFDTSGL